MVCEEPITSAMTTMIERRKAMNVHSSRFARRKTSALSGGNLYAAPMAFTAVPLP